MNTSILFINITAMIISIPIIWWLFKSRQMLNIFFTIILLLIILINNPLPETMLLTLHSIPCEFTTGFFTNSFFNKITDVDILRKLSNCYTEDTGRNKFILKKGLTDVEKKELQSVLETIPYTHVKILFWVPVFLEPGTEQQVTMAIEYKGETTENLFRISSALDKNILLSGNTAIKNTEEFKSNILFQGKLSNAEIINKKITLHCFEQGWRQCALRLTLERLIISGLNSEWSKEGSEILLIREAYKFSSLVPQISGIIALAISVLTILMKLIEIWQKKHDTT